MQKWHLAGMKYASLAIIFIAILHCVSSHANPVYDASKPHHTPTGFQNNYVKAVDKSFGDLLRWQWESRGLPKPPQQAVPVVQPHLALIQA